MFTVKCSCPVCQIWVNNAYYPLKKRDFLESKRHSPKHGFTLMIVFKGYHKVFFVPVEGSMNACLNKSGPIRFSKRVAAAFPFTSNTKSSLMKAIRPTPTLRNAPRKPGMAGPSPRRSRKAARTPSRAPRENPRPATAAAAAGFTANTRHTTPSACVCATRGGAKMNQTRRKENEK